MQTLVFARQRLTAFREELARLEHSEFPYPAAQEALRRIRQVFDGHAQMLDLLDEHSNQDTIYEVCEQQLRNLWDYLPFLGFILRSTNVRNAFEMYVPLQRLAWRILGPEAQLLISSEWDYSPFIYTQVPLLPGFVLIGLPAHESGNPLVTPLAGHELGHALWSSVVERSLWHPSFIVRLKTNILTQIRAQWDAFVKLFPQVAKPEYLDTELFATAAWSPAFDWALRQSEEYFCDFAGLRLFGESYLYAFAHLLSPVLRGMRAFQNPNMMRRVNFQLRAAEVYGITPPAHYATWFKDRQEPSDEIPHEKFLVGLADSAADELAPELIAHVDSVLRQPELPDWSNADSRAEHAAIVKRIYADFSMVAPAEKAKHIAHILNAGWQAAMHSIPTLAEHSSQQVLRELVLKSLEVLEFEVKNPPS